MRKIVLLAGMAAAMAVGGLVVGGAAAGSVPGLTHLGGATAQTPHSAQPPHPTGVLYSQNDNDNGVGIVSQNFEAEFDVFDSQDADDFVVPDTGHPWQITGVTVTGVYFNGSGPAASETVTLYKDANGVPGDVVNTQTVVGTDSGGSFTIPLAKFALPRGHYWVSVQANMDFNSGGEWAWETRNGQNGTAAVWQNPADGFGTGCTTWMTMVTCIPSGEGPDLMFSLSGSVLGAP